MAAHRGNFPHQWVALDSRSIVTTSMLPSPLHDWWNHDVTATDRPRPSRAEQREHHRFVPTDRGATFAITTRPAGDVRRHLLVCSPIGGDFETNYRREVMLSRALADVSIATTRFHPRASGNSDGPLEALSFDGYIQDALDLAEALAPELGAPTDVLGTRIAGLMAPSIAR